MAQHMQHALPPHLQKYQNSSTPVPRHIEKAMADHMKKSAPAHLRQYVDSYVQQRVVAPTHPVNAPAAGGFAVPHPVPSAPTGQTLHSSYAPPTPAGSQPQSPTIPAPLSAPVTPPGVAPASQTPQINEPNYDFILSPQAPRKPSWSLPGGTSILSRFIIFGGGLVVLLIVAAILKSLLFNNGDSYKPLITVAQDQQQLMHLAENASQEPGLSTANQNFAATVQFALKSSQTKTDRKSVV